MYRLFDEDNSTLVNDWTYLVESLYHEMFLQVGCRSIDSYLVLRLPVIISC